MTLATTYLGLHLPHPLVVGPGPMSDDLGEVRELEDAGAAAFVLSPLYEEEVVGEQMTAFFQMDCHAESFAEAASHSAVPRAAFGPDEYLEHLRRVKQAVRVPVLAALDCVTPGGWLSYARRLEQAGADAIELHLYHAASDPEASAAEVERGMIDIVREVKQALRIPVAVKLSPFFTAFANFAEELDGVGADGLTLFTRFHRADIDVTELEVLRSFPLSKPAELALRLRGVAALTGRVKASLAVCGGVHGALDVVKSIMTGAHATHLVSTLILNGARHLELIRRELEAWLAEHDWSSLDELRGKMAFDMIPAPPVYERAHFRAART
jgi:dihydroorotate dehydrogenase (fumarate)